MATIIGSGPRKPPRIMARKNIVVKRLPRGVQGRDDETEKLKREGYEVQAGVLTVNQNHPSNFKPKQLPGVANDVESYPCRFCEEKVFLTASGLEKHAKEAHVQNLEDILADIQTISGEWKKREFELLRSRERLSMDKLRHEARANQLVRAVLAGDAIANTVSGEQYESCAICNMLINIAHPTAMDSHQKAHKKNDELRLQLIDQYGAEAVTRLTCEACSLVFPDDQKLNAHINSHHTRKKKYICKFCGHISHSMSELNLHKSDVHNYSTWNNVPEFLKARRSFFQYDDDSKRMKRKTQEEMEDEAAVRQPMIGEVSEGDTAGRVTCPECGLKLNRPRLLFKHMERVHMKSSFSCMVETGGLPTFEIQVTTNEIFWLCCDAKFDNRGEFIEHRRLHIPTQHEEVVVAADETLPTTSQTILALDGGVGEDGEPTGHQIQVQFVEHMDGSYQVHWPEGMEIPGTFVVDVDEYGTKTFRFVPADQMDQLGHHLILQQDQEMIPDEVEEEMMLDGDGVEEEDEDAFAQYSMQWDNMEMQEMMLVPGDGVLEEEQVEEHLEHHQMLENVEEEVVEINGRPLYH